MFPLGSLGVLPLLSLCVGAMLSPPDAPPACPHCKDSLVAAPPARTGSGECEGRPGMAGCRVAVAPLAASDPPLRVEHRHEARQVQPESRDVSERLVQLQRCMNSLQEPGVPRGRVGQGGDTLGAILALMAAVLTECDLHCHSQALRAMARRLEGAAVGREGEKDLILLLRSITQHPPTEYTAVRAQVCVAAVPSARLHPQDCAEIYRLGIKENGIYTIQPDPRRPAVEAECDMDTAGGGWTVFQRRRDGSVDFNRTWQEYREGFGSPQGEYWLGNAALHALTNTGQHLLRIQLEDWHQQKRQATYNTFRVAAEAQRYRLTAREYSGDAGNALSYSKRYNHDGRAFSTNDRDHDRYTSGNCAEYYGAGWWFDACLASNLNGLFYRGRYSGLTNGIYWGTWYILTDIHSGERYSFKSVEMKTRPRNF
ncbi:fibroleukin-like isoform X1 [Oncorhynchus kisutch]|uniref:fibroleukin-like isoform X1 n=1 Tax=Oncorhynchus kisutch TaxID=8019 RepID=UPI0012DC5132|nr:fibroleukin-like isoform X1 [Oncorhynchus kisutch]